MAKMAASLVESGEDAFRKIFKFYKRRNPPPDLSNVLDFSKDVPSGKMVPVKLDPARVSEDEAARVGLQPVRDWRAFELQGYPGFIFIINPFLLGSRAFWVRQCLKTYPQKPNVCNLDRHMSPSDTQDIWGKSAPDLRGLQTVPRRAETLQVFLPTISPAADLTNELKVLIIQITCFSDWLEGEPAASRPSVEQTYCADHHTPFPADLHQLSLCVTAACGFPGFNAEAGILNYYRPDSSLGIHVDESELDHSRPLLSFSFGQSAIFLLGGVCRQDAPTAMYMHSGDMMVMSGQSRLLHHAVPRILPAPLHHTSGTDSCSLATPPQDGAVVEPVSQEDWAACSRYIQSSRVNVTVRQVLGPGQTFPQTPPSHRTGGCHGAAAGEERGKRKRSL